MKYEIFLPYTGLCNTSFIPLHLSKLLMKGFFLILNLVFLFPIILNCSQEIHKENDPDFTLGYEGVIYYKGNLYTGVQVAEFPNGVKRVIEVRNGKEDGRTYDTYPNGSTSAEYFYKNGKKVGTHRGWYEDGTPRFHYEYSDGENHGEHWEWQPDGKIYSLFKYNRGKIIGQKVWRKDGQIYANTIYTPEKVYGVKGSKLCFTVKGDDTGKKTESY